MEKYKQIFALLISFLTMLFSLFSGSPKPAPEVVPEPEPEQINVIYMIGDGMGFNHLEATKKYLGTSLFMDTFAVKGSVTTASANSSITDSAAAGTALACGVKTNNGCIGVYDTDVNAETSYPMSLTQLAQKSGLKTGVITTDKPYGATPGAFTAHTSSRDNSADIVSQQMSSGIDLLWFAESGTYWTDEDAAANSYTYVTNREEAMALTPGSKTVGEFTQSTMWKGERSSVYSVNPSLSELTTKAIEVLDSKDGFFLMVEGAHIDKNSHNNDMELMSWAVDEFDNAVEAAVNYAKHDGNTVVVVTADHETGGIALQDDGSYIFTKSSHSSANVPLFIYGDTGLFENGAVIDNTDVAKKVAAEFTESAFPAAVSVTAAE